MAIRTWAYLWAQLFSLPHWVILSTYKYPHNQTLYIFHLGVFLDHVYVFQPVLLLRISNYTYFINLIQKIYELS